MAHSTFDDCHNYLIFFDLQKRQTPIVVDFGSVFGDSSLVVLSEQDELVVNGEAKLDGFEEGLLRMRPSASQANPAAHIEAAAEAELDEERGDVA